MRLAPSTRSAATFEKSWVQSAPVSLGSWGERAGGTYLVQLVEVAKQHMLLRQLREQLAPHLPSPFLLRRPAVLDFRRVRSALSVVVAEERVLRKDDVL